VRPNSLRFGFCFDGRSKLCVVGEVVIIVGARVNQYVWIERFGFDHSIVCLLGILGSGEGFPAAKVAESCGSEA
jgi:hypothetical protein